MGQTVVQEVTYLHVHADFRFGPSCRRMARVRTHATMLSKSRTMQ